MMRRVEKRRRDEVNLDLADMRRRGKDEWKSTAGKKEGGWCHRRR
jgi:hypothetical protein